MFYLYPLTSSHKVKLNTFKKLMSMKDFTNYFAILTVLVSFVLIPEKYRVGRIKIFSFFSRLQKNPARSAQKSGSVGIVETQLCLGIIILKMF